MFTQGVAAEAGTLSRQPAVLPSGTLLYTHRPEAVLHEGVRQGPASVQADRSVAVHCGVPPPGGSRLMGQVLQQG